MHKNMPMLKYLPSPFRGYQPRLALEANIPALDDYPELSQE